MRLRDVPEDRASMQAYVDFLEERVKVIDIHEGEAYRAAVKLYGEIGAYAKMLGRPEIAIAALTKSLKIIDDKKMSVSVWAIHTLRYGDALRYNNDALGAETSFRSVIEMADRFSELKDLEDFAWQHLGKLKFEEGDVSGAMDCLNKAKAIRAKKGVKELIDNTDSALKIVQSKLAAKKKY